MNGGLVARAWRETRALTLLLAVGLVVVETVLGYAPVRFQGLINMAMAHVALFEKMLHALVGATVAGQIRPEMLPAIAWMHPVLLAMVWAHAITYCTRVPAGEVDRGTIDVLLGLPVSRWGLCAAETLVWLVSGLVLMAAVAAGNRLGNFIAGGPRIEPRRLVILAVNLYCLYVAVGGFSWFISSLSDRRGRAVAGVLAFVLGSFLLHYLGPFVEFAERISFLSLLHYYVPFHVLRDGLWPVEGMAVLVAIGAVLWAAGGAIFARRDLATV
jgi:ABC-2 type transport system permease protein